MTAVGADDRVRFCGQCKKNVYNVAALAPEEALDLVDRMEGGLCIRLSRRPDGTLVTGDCRARLRYARRRGRVAFVCALVVVFGVQLWTQAFGLKLLLDVWMRPTARSRQIMGAMGAPAAPKPATAVPALPPPTLGAMGAPGAERHVLLGKMAPPQTHTARRK